MVKINKIIEPISELYNSENKLVGKIHSILELDDVRVQIKLHSLEGYYIVWKNHTINIDKYGRLQRWPRGFYDQGINLLESLL